ncbi:MAG: hypothetical protein OXQ94_14705 [Gemmatimonadota bacterium]|nr:hypothetical protein [Gemmatimonadota bacterium]MDE2872925.1 hypothetical protein [Gemmatimonadota bacterium]
MEPVSRELWLLEQAWRDAAADELLLPEGAEDFVREGEGGRAN